jgi:AcrR family transcriptional regulator
MPVTKASRGRKAQLSRDKIVEKALELLNSANPENFSIRRLAQALSVTPAAIYVYFEGQDDILRLAAEEVASRVDLARIPTDTHWRHTLEAWAHAVRDNHRTYPHATLMLKMSQHIPTAWYRVIEPVWQTFELMGCSEEQKVELTQAYIRGVAGLVMIELEHDDTINVHSEAELTATLESASPADREKWSRFLPKLGSIDIDSLFDQSLGLLLDGIALRVPSSAL